MDVADEMNEKRKVAYRARFVVIPIAKTLRVFIDFGGDTIPIWAPRQ